MDFQWSAAINALPTILNGLRLTMLIAIVGIALGFVLGVLAGVARCSTHRVPYAIASVYISIIRGTPLMVQAMYLYFAIPIMLNFNLPATPAGITAIGLNSGAYIAEIVRGAIQSVDVGQTEAGICLGLSKFQVSRGIVFPQAFRIMLPSLGNQFVISVKDTSILTVIGVAEMTHQAARAVSSTFRTVEIYTMLAALYYVLCSLLSFALHIIERKVHNG